MNFQPNKHRNIPRDITIYCNLVFKRPIQKAAGGRCGGKAHYLQGKEFINLHQGSLWNGSCMAVSHPHPPGLPSRWQMLAEVN